MKENYYTVKKYVVETYEVRAQTREEAIDDAVSPNVVNVQRVTCVKQK